MLLRCLCGVAISTGLIGMWPGMHLAWVFTGLAGLAALGLVGLMAYAKELEAEQRRRRARRKAGRGRRDGPVDPATAGYPGGLGRRRLRGAPGRSALSGPPHRHLWTSHGRSGRLPAPDYPGSPPGV